MQIVSCSLALWHMRIYYILFEHLIQLISRPKNLLVYSPSLSRKTYEGKKRNIESITSVTMTRAISSHESSCLANCRPLHVSVYCRLIFVRSLQEASVGACR